MAQRPTAQHRLVAGEYNPRSKLPTLVEWGVVEFSGAASNVGRNRRESGKAIVGTPHKRN
jgi:hypothetical protein